MKKSGVLVPILVVAGYRLNDFFLAWVAANTDLNVTFGCCVKKQNRQA